MLTIVYQDCPVCGNRKAWGERTIAKATKAGKEIRKLSFASPEGAHLCKEAIYAGMTKLPFITDGVKFSQEIGDFLEKKPKSLNAALNDPKFMKKVAKKADEAQAKTLGKTKKRTRKPEAEDGAI